MTTVDDLPDVEGYYNRRSGKWHVLETCARIDKQSESLRAAIQTGRPLCRVCCSARQWYDAALEAQDE